MRTFYLFHSFFKIQLDKYKIFNEVLKQFKWNYSLKFRKSPLHLAIIYNNIEIVKLLLLSQKVNVNIQSISKHQIFSFYCKSNNLMQSKIILFKIKF